MTLTMIKNIKKKYGKFCVQFMTFKNLEAKNKKNLGKKVY